MSDSRSTEATQLIHAPREAVYKAFVEADALAQWLAPDTMKGRVEALDARQGGMFRMSLTYTEPQDATRGKSSDDTDRFEGKIVELVPNEKIVWVTEFDSDQPEMMGEMTIIWTLTDANSGTNVRVVFEDIPIGVKLEDNELGSRQSLKKLAAFVEHSSPS